MATNPVETVDLEDRWRPLSDAEKGTAQALLDDAWATLLTLAPAADGADEGVLRSVISAAVLRVLRNPEGTRSESIDDYSWTRDAAVSSGSLYYSEDELRLVRGVRARAQSVTYANNTSAYNTWRCW